MQMKHLEAYLGQPLFDRSGLQVRPTRLAHDVSTLMRDALRQLEALRKRDSMTVKGVVRLGVIESMQPVLLPTTMRVLRARHPGMELRPARAAAHPDRFGEVGRARRRPGRPARGRRARHACRWHPVLPPISCWWRRLRVRRRSVAALFKQYEWIRYARETVTGSLASRFVGAQHYEKRGHLEFDSAPAIIAW
jgi:DNA-binding transcriptional LysR family regulator